MKKCIIVIAIVLTLATVTLFTGCVRVDLSEKNGPLTTQTYDYTDFTGIQVGNAFTLDVTPSDTYSINITAGKNILDHIVVSKSGSTLKIQMDSWHFSWWWETNPRITITMPVLKVLDLSGASQVTALGFNSTEDFTLKISGASHLDLDMVTGYFTSEISGASGVAGRLTANGSDIHLSGASRIDLTGTGGDVKLNGSGASHSSLLYYTANNGDIELTGASDANMDITGRMNVDLSGASSLKYAGNPTLGKIDVSGASSLDKRSLP